jgi:hypothetical protein
MWDYELLQFITKSTDYKVGLFTKSTDYELMQFITKSTHVGL